MNDCTDCLEPYDDHCEYCTACPEQDCCEGEQDDIYIRTRAITKQTLHRGPTSRTLRRTEPPIHRGGSDDTL